MRTESANAIKQDDELAEFEKPHRTADVACAIWHSLNPAWRRKTIDAAVYRGLETESGSGMDCIQSVYSGKNLNLEDIKGVNLDDRYQMTKKALRKAAPQA